MSRVIGTQINVAAEIDLNYCSMLDLGGTSKLHELIAVSYYKNRWKKCEFRPLCSKEESVTVFDDAEVAMKEKYEVLNSK